MKQPVKAVLVLAMLALTGCGSGPISNGGAADPALTGNWQIQTGGGTGATPALGALLLGDLVSSRGNVSGTFRYSNLSQPIQCDLNQVVTVSGTVDAARDLLLTSAPLPDGSIIRVQLAALPILTSFATGTIEVSGTTCGLASGPAIGVELAPVTGTFVGPMTPGTLSGTVPGTAGTGSLVLTEAATAGPDGQFSVSGTLNYTIGACTGSVTFAGQHSGGGLSLQGIPATLTDLPPAAIFGTAIPDGSKINTELSFLGAPCAAGASTPVEYAASLVRQ